MTIETVDIVIVGAGPAGLAAASEVSRLGARVVVLDESVKPGGRLLGQIHLEPQGGWLNRRLEWSNGPGKAQELSEKATKAGARILCGASVWGIMPGWFIGTSPSDPSFEDKKFPVGYKAKSVLIATGAFQNPLPMPGWTLPRAITAGAAQNLINMHKVMPGRRAAIIGADPLGISVGQLMSSIGMEVSGVFLPPSNSYQNGPSTPHDAIQSIARFSTYAPSYGLSLAGRLAGHCGKLISQFFPRNGINIGGFPLMLRRAVLAIEGDVRVEGVTTAALRPDGRVEPMSIEHWPVDVVVSAAGLSPLTELAHVAGCPLVHIEDLGGWVPIHNNMMETPVPGLFLAGSISGVEGAAVAECQGRLAGISMAGYLGLTDHSGLEPNILNIQSEIKVARKKSLPLLPNIERARFHMNDLFERHVKSETRISSLGFKSKHDKMM